MNDTTNQQHGNTKMIFIKWKQQAQQLLINASKDAKGALIEKAMSEALKGFSSSTAIQYKAYAVYDAEKVENPTKLIQICRGI